MILHLITSIEPAGAQRILHTLLNSSSHRNDSVIYFYRTLAQLEGLSCNNNVYFLQFPRNFFGFPSFVLRYIKLYQKINPSIVNSWLYHADLISVFSRVFFRTPTIWSIHNGDLTNQSFFIFLVFKTLAFFSYFIPSRIIYCSNFSQKAHESFGYCQQIGTVIHNGFDSNLFSFSFESRCSIRSTLSISPDQYVIGFFSRYSPVKDVPCIIKSFSHHIKNYPNSILMMIGQGFTSDNQHLIDLFASSQVDILNNVRLLGPKENISIYYSAIDTFALTSKAESFPNVVCEALLSSCSVVSTNVGDCSFIITDDKYLLAPGDYLSFARLFDEFSLFYSMNDFARPILSSELISRLSLQGMITSYDTIYSSLLY